MDRYLRPKPNTSVLPILRGGYRSGGMETRPYYPDTGRRTASRRTEGLVNSQYSRGQIITTPFINGGGCYYTGRRY